MSYSKDVCYVVRTENAGVFVGYIESMDDVTRKCVLKDSRRLWYWDGAASLSELAMRGVSKPENCKFPCIVAEVNVFEVIEIIPMSIQATQSIMNVPIWSE